MPISLTGLRVFIASPSGLAKERERFRSTLLAYNEDHAIGNGISFIPVGWESVSPGAERPQERINRKLRGSDYFVLVLWDRWGTPSDTNGHFSSGTHEEFSTALECLADAEAPMRDVVVFFKGVNERALSDPGEQLKQVRKFKQGLEEHKQLLYKTFDSEDELTRYLQQLMGEWSGSHEEKTPREITDPMKEAAEGTDEADIAPEALLAHALDLEDQGLVTQAEVTFAAAVVTEDPEALVAYAKFLRRTGRLEGAFEVNEKILTQQQLLVDDTAAARAQKADVLANMGVIRRKQGELVESRRLLDESVKTAKLAGEAGETVLGYALDNLGLTLRRLGDTGAALERYEEAKALREAAGDDLGAARSAVNMTRLVRDTDPKRAIDSIQMAIEVFKSHDEARQLANALVAYGEILAGQDNLEEAAQQISQALKINEDLEHSDGIAVASGQLSRVLVQQGRLDEAEDAAQRSLETNQRSANAEGLAAALRQVGAIRAEKGELEAAATYLKRSLELVVSQGNSHAEPQVAELLIPVLRELGRYDEADQLESQLES